MQEHIASLSPVTVVTRTTIARSSVLAGTVALFAVTMFTGASLLFLVQPMFAKLALPRLGGSPSVWNTCVLFFQATLLLGYLYAHFSTRWLGVRRQIYLHLLLLIVPFVALPLTMGDGQPSSASPIWWLLGTMTLSVGLPFFVVSTTAPLLQRWFATLPVPSARDPSSCTPRAISAACSRCSRTRFCWSRRSARDNRRGCGRSATSSSLR